MDPDTSEGIESDEFFFESENLALRDNKDYCALLKTLVILEAQRSQALKDLDILSGARIDALKDPLGFVERLQKKENLRLPELQQIAEIPVVDWSRYNITSAQAENCMSRRRKPQITSSVFKKGSAVITRDGRQFLVRGRKYDGTKPQTFNQLWTPEEQRRLEQLLVDFPAEDVEMRRWEKIARALGNRSSQQVQSRVQKYFIKLQKLGLPVPGRRPSHAIVKKNWSLHQRKYMNVMRPSTMLPMHILPVLMDAEEDDRDDVAERSAASSSWSSRNSRAPSPHDSDNDTKISEELMESEEYRELRRLEKLKEDILGQETNVNYKCDGCGCEPIVSTRWECTLCCEVDLCSNCAHRPIAIRGHTPAHPLRQAAAHSQLDSDYSNSHAYNYLDPNFMPAN